MDSLDDGIYYAGVGKLFITLAVRGLKSNQFKTYCRSITKLVLLTRKDLSQNPTHDLATARLRKIRDNEDGFWRSEWTNALSNLQNEIFAELVIDLISIFNGNERVNCLASELVVDADNGCFRDCVVLNECCFDLGG